MADDEQSYQELLDAFVKCKELFEVNEVSADKETHINIPLPSSFLTIVINGIFGESQCTNEEIRKHIGAFNKRLYDLSKNHFSKMYENWPENQDDEFSGSNYLIKIIDDPDDLFDAEYSNENTDDDDDDKKDDSPKFAAIPSEAPSQNVPVIQNSKSESYVSSIFNKLVSNFRKPTPNVAQLEESKSEPLPSSDILSCIEEDPYLVPQMLSLHKSVWKWMFDQVVDPIVAHCVQILENDKMEGTKYIFLVGGFARSKYFQMRMKTEFGKNPKYQNLSVEIPTFPDLCVVDGAARYGSTQNFVKVRTMRKTYGLALDNCFCIFKRKGEEVYLNDNSVTKKLQKKDPDSDEPIVLKVYCSEKQNPLTVTRKEDKVRLMGSVSVPVTKDQKQIAVELQFFNTTIIVSSYPIGSKGKRDGPKMKCTLRYSKSSYSHFEQENMDHGAQYEKLGM